MKHQPHFRLIFFIMLPALAALFLNFAPVEPPRWEHLGTRKVNYGLDRDEILVTVSEGRFDAIKLLVKHSPVNMHRVVIHFGNGMEQEVEVRNQIPAGGETRVIDIRGENRVIRKVVFWYDTKGLNDRRAVVELWGRH